MKALLIAALLGLTACAGTDESKIIKNTYFKTSSTCNSTQTDLIIPQPNAFEEGSKTYFDMVQKNPYRNCQFTVKGFFTIQGNAATTKFFEGTLSTKGDCSGTELVWDEVYSFTLVGTTLTLSSNSCTTTYQKP